MALLHLRVIGGFAAVLPTGQPVEISGKKKRALFTYLALHTDNKPTREKLSVSCGATGAKSSTERPPPGAAGA
jgi:hypothetical protein